MPLPETMHVQVVCAWADRAIEAECRLAEGSTVADALALALKNPRFAGCDFSLAPVGIFGRVVQRNQRLYAGDRVEIYRPLEEDPKTARRQRARRAP